MMDKLKSLMERYGYSEYTDQREKYADAFFQKIIRDEDRTFLYALNAYLYDFNRYGHSKVCGVLKAHLYLDAETQRHFAVQSDEFLSEEGLVREERLFADLYQRMGCVPDPLND